MKGSIKQIAGFLIVAFLFTMVPITAKAEEKTPASAAETGTPTNEETQIKEASVVKELEDKREENKKYFLMDDGTYQAVMYNEPVHYLKDGKWEDIDNTLVDASEDTDVNDMPMQTEDFINGAKEQVNKDSVYTEDEDGDYAKDEEGNNSKYYQNTENEISVKIAKNVNDKKLVSIKKDNYEVSWNIKAPNKSKGEEKEKDIDSEIDEFTKNDKSKDKETKKENIKKIIADKNDSQVDFNEISEGVDLQYLLKGKTLKENIVINKAIDSNVFSFNLSLKNLIPEIKDNTVRFLDKKTKQEVFNIVPPVMYDANGETSSDVKIDVKENKKGYTLTLTPNKEWINDSKRSYPIVVDPNVTSTLSRYDIIATFVASIDTSDKDDNLFVRVGNVPGNVGTAETYIKFNNLPKLKTGDMVVGANLFLTKIGNYSGYDGEIEAHRILVPWDQSTLTWSNRPSVDNSKAEYKITDTQNVSGNLYSWDITNMAKYWYNYGDNNGLLLRRTNPSSGHTTFLSSDTSNTYSGGWPQVVISYINNSGLENYWTYHSQNAGRAGTGYINDYNGNLIFTHNDVDNTGNRNPLTITHVYNSNDRADSIGYGLGWRTNINQRVISEVISGTQYYDYIDGDGTKHYFKYDSASSSYKSDDGLDVTFKINADNSYNITDKDGNDLYFVPGGYINQITDKNGNTNIISYHGTTLYQITDSSGRQNTFESTPEGYLLSITDFSGRKTQFRYTGIDLTTITYPDGKVTTYAYDGNHNLISATNFDGLKLTYGYNTAAPYRTSSVKQTGSDGVSGGQLTIDYGFNETDFTDAKGRVETYQFNNWGNTTSITDPNGNATAYEYGVKGSNAFNKLELDSKLESSNRNYLKNHSVEPAEYNWEQGFWGPLSKGSGNLTTEAAFLGSNSLKVSKTDYGDRIFYSQSVNLTKGKTYVFSGYIKTTDVTKDMGKGAALFVNYQDNSGEWETIESNYVTGTTDWERYSVSFTLPEDSASNLVYIREGLLEDKGVAYFDALQLEEGNIESRYNLLENSQFDYGEATSEKWTYNTSDSNGIATNFENRSSFRIKGDLGQSKNIYQTLNVSGGAGDCFVMSGWAKADALPKESGTNRYFALDLGINYTDGTTEWTVANFNSDTGNWQFTSGKAIANKAYTSLIFYALYYNEENFVWFDNLQLFKEQFGQSYEYDSKGNIQSTKNLLGKVSSKFEYNANNDLITATDAKDNKYSFTYDAKRNVKTATSPMNVVGTFDYDAYGNPTKSTVGDTTTFISASATYTSNGNYLATNTDALGNTVNYNYDPNKGTLLTTTDPKGNTTTNTYDPNTDSLKTTSKTVDGKVITNSYQYLNDRIDTITHNGFNYKFSYDSVGRNTGVNVGTQKLITNAYDPITGNLTKSTYGNGNIVENGYDNLDRITSKKANGLEIAHYSYDSNGSLGLLEDRVNNVTYKYTYDLADRLAKVTDSKGNVFRNDFDVNNNVSKQTSIINGNTYSTGYNYDKDNRIDTITLNSESENVKYHYDTLGRNDSRTIAFGNGKTYLTSYGFKAGANGSQSTRVESVNNNGSILNYTYDKNGNIETISQGTALLQKFYYNELSELIREDNKALNKTIAYSYDAGGNIVSKTEYPYTNGSLGIATGTKVYQYGDANWKDKLTSYNGKAITYDAIGNPLTYDGNTYTWDRGRTLTGITGNGKTILYKYNDSGIRTEKNVNGVVSKYTLNGDKVVYEEVTNGSTVDKIYYTYDASNNLISIKLNGTEYFYVRNGQGDIIGLVDTNGTQVVSYSYDSWGKLLSIDGTLKDTLGIKNPYRYRGYRYDTETGMYYLNSRYYNPDWGRFINEDEIAAVTGDLLSTNMFAYCLNNPINMSDKDGDRPDYGDGQGHETDEQREASLAEMYANNPDVLFYKEHTNNARPSTQEKHQKGQTRKQRDSGGEKGDARRRPNPNKRRPQNIDITPPDFKTRALLVGGGILIIGGTLVEDVVTGGAGVADDSITLSSGMGLIIRAFAS
ncbi:DNRLRE domain-containing protein [Clostridium sp. YIM B02551]|uniref:DNRLRE domain-containing protein n=1 Tax=Clostridium sp. YIM B02551 TaxID=2910679 RepID=UPI001EEAC2F4|nr:DNRLRE domain-containing protein [Clostridium sp. YIM B02551]